MELKDCVGIMILFLIRAHPLFIILIILILKFMLIKMMRQIQNVTYVLAFQKLAFSSLVRLRREDYNEKN